MIDSKKLLRQLNFPKNLLILAVKQRHPEHFKSTHFENLPAAAWPNG